MEFFSSAVSALSTMVTAIGGVVGIWGVINLMEGYGRGTGSRRKAAQAP